MTKKKTTTKKVTKKKTSKKTPAKRPVGRPTEYRQEYCQKLIDHMASGLSFETFGVSIGMVTATTYKWLEKHPEFVEAKNIAEQECRRFWERMGTGIAAGKLKNGNSGVWIYNMKCRFPKVWRPKKEIDVNARYERDLKEIESMSAEQLANLAETAAKYLKAKESDES